MKTKKVKTAQEILINFSQNEAGESCINELRKELLNALLLALGNIDRVENKDKVDCIFNVCDEVNDIVRKVSLKKDSEEILTEVFWLEGKKEKPTYIQGSVRDNLNDFVAATITSDRLDGMHEDDYENLIWLFKKMTDLINDTEALLLSTWASDLGKIQAKLELVTDNIMKLGIERQIIETDDFFNRTIVRSFAETQKLYELTEENSEYVLTILKKVNKIEGHRK
jgi:hypothetical protein